MRITMVLAAMAILSATARGESVNQTWIELPGWGWTIDPLTQDRVPFATSDASLTMSMQWDPASGWAAGYIEVNIPEVGYDVVANFDPQVSGTTFSAQHGEGGTITATFFGDPGLNPNVYLESATVTPGYHEGDSLTFFGGDPRPVPEPSGVVMLATGIGGAVLIGRRRR